MPHCIAEHSSDIDGSALLPAIHRGAFQSDLFASDIKVRSIAYDHCKLETWSLNFVDATTLDDVFRD